jgi:hypothetical protein
VVCLTLSFIFQSDVQSFDEHFFFPHDYFDSHSFLSL